MKLKTNIEVLNGGLLTTIQDGGRYGYQELGIAVSGAMDLKNFRLANAILGNDLNEANLEMTFAGPMLKFENDISICITGANSRPKLDGAEIEMYSQVPVKSGQVLSFGKFTEGIRGYIAFSGSIDVPIVNGSKSTHIKTSMGGFEGRALKRGDKFEIILNENAKTGNKLESEYIPRFSKFNVLRAVPGPQDDYFSEKELFKFFNSGGYSLTKDFDRMGIRLKGEKIKHIDGADIISDATNFGSVQIPNEGYPIVLMADRQTTGGYTKIANVVSVDLSNLAQASYGDKVTFQRVEMEEAQKLFIKEKKTLEEIAIKFK